MLNERVILFAEEPVFREEFDIMLTEMRVYLEGSDFA